MSSDDDIELETVPDDDSLEMRRDPEVPEADALDQAREVTPGARVTQVSKGIDVPEADALEQAIEEPLDIDDDRAT